MGKRQGRSSKARTGSGGLGGFGVLPDRGQALADGCAHGSQWRARWLVAADFAGGDGLVAERAERGLGRRQEQRVGSLNRDLVLGDADDHVAAACLFWLLVGGARDLSGAQRLLGLVEVHAKVLQRPGGGGLGVGERGEQQVMRPDGLFAGQPGGLSERDLARWGDPQRRLRLALPGTQPGLPWWTVRRQPLAQPAEHAVGCLVPRI